MPPHTQNLKSVNLTHSLTHSHSQESVHRVSRARRGAVPGGHRGAQSQEQQPPTDHGVLGCSDQGSWALMIGVGHSGTRASYLMHACTHARSYVVGKCSTCII